MANSAPAGDPRYLPFLEIKQQAQLVEQLMDGEPVQISVNCAQLQRLFQNQVQSLDWADWPEHRRSLLQSIRVEMHKQLRLLTTDLMFFRAAKQAETLAQRRREMGDRLRNLQGYCDAIIKLAEETKTDESITPEKTSDG